MDELNWNPERSTSGAGDGPLSFCAVFYKFLSNGD